MLDSTALLLVVLDFCYIGLLPFIFFKRSGRFGPAWWVTAGPLFVTPVFLVATHFEWMRIPTLGEIPESWGLWQSVATVPLSVLSVCLMSVTIGTHRIPIALWHQKDDAPQSIVTWGAYARIRHPFYSSFLLAQFAALALLPHPVTGASGMLTLVVLTVTARREERRLCASEFGEEYSAYMRNTGRFFPRLWGRGG